eukprot:XP_001705657.1 Hypothetical protein GL50803_35806 [Giardia lamblia ATCC 50803]
MKCLIRRHPLLRKLQMMDGMTPSVLPALQVPELFAIFVHGSGVVGLIGSPLARTKMPKRSYHRLVPCQRRSKTYPLCQLIG